MAGVDFSEKSMEPRRDRGAEAAEQLVGETGHQKRELDVIWPSSVLEPSPTIGEESQISSVQVPLLAQGPLASPIPPAFSALPPKEHTADPLF